VQVDESSTRRYGGTGLGTSIAHDLVVLMGAQLAWTAPQVKDRHSGLSCLCPRRYRVLCSRLGTPRAAKFWS
jgi:signal transduction histidine kinase